MLVEVSIASRELQAADNLLKWVSINYGTDAFVFSDVLQFGPPSWGPLESLLGGRGAFSLKSRLKIGQEPPSPLLEYF